MKNIHTLQFRKIESLHWIKAPLTSPNASPACSLPTVPPTKVCGIGDSPFDVCSSILAIFDFFAARPVR